MKGRRFPLRFAALTAALLALTACATGVFMPRDDTAYPFLSRTQTRSEGSIRLRAALPARAEVREMFGLDLHEQGVQPLWLEISNGSDQGVWVSLWSIDRDYFSPAEVAYTNRRHFRRSGYEAFERWLLETAMPRRIPPGATRSGFVYTHLTEGTKGFNLDVFGPTEDHNFTLLLDDPGFVPDYRLIDFEGLYASSDRTDLSVQGLWDLVGGLPCCATGPDGETQGLPFNVVIVGSGKSLRRAMVRGEWRETRAADRGLVPQAPQYFDGREADGRFYLERSDATAELVIDLWLTPLSVDGRPVWLGQSYFREVDAPLVRSLRSAIAPTERAVLFARFVGEAISADLDSAQELVIQNLMYNQSVEKIAFARGTPQYDAENPGVTYDGLGYITKGIRAILFVSETPVAFGDTELLSVPNEDGEPEPLRPPG